MKPRQSIRPEEGDPDQLGKSYMGLCYRLSRRILTQKGLLGLGQTIAEAASLLPESIFADARQFGPERSDEPANPHEEGANPQKQAKNLILEAFRLGLDPEDPRLKWLEEDCLHLFPTGDELLRFEDRLSAVLGRKMVDQGRVAALKAAERILGELAGQERRDFVGLSYARSRELASSGTEDDRLVMAARLESISKRARRSLDLRTELAAQRALGSVQGLTQIDADKSQRELILLLGKPDDHGTGQAALPPPEESKRPRISVLPG